MNHIVKLTALQAYFLNDLDVSGSESYAEAVAAGLRVDGLKLIVPPAAAAPLATAIGIRADLADEGSYDLGERSTILGLAKKVARVPGAKHANPLPLHDFLPSPKVTKRDVEAAPISVTTLAREDTPNRTGAGRWLDLIHEVNRIAPGTFGNPNSVGPEAGVYTERYDDAFVWFPPASLRDGDEVVIIRSRTDHGARLIRQAANKLGLAEDVDPLTLRSSR